MKQFIYTQKLWIVGYFLISTAGLLFSILTGSKFIIFLAGMHLGMGIMLSMVLPLIKSMDNSNSSTIRLIKSLKNENPRIHNK